MRVLKPFAMLGGFLKRNYKLVLETVAVVGGLAVLIIYFLQWRVMDKSLTVDERAWLKVDLTGKAMVAENVPILTNITVSNAGKTPAKHIAVATTIEVVSNGEAPQFTAAHDVSLYTENLLFPGEATSPPIEVKSLQAGIPFAVPKPLSHDDYQRLIQGKAWIAIYGKITYEDFFGESRWVKFCAWNSPSIQPTMVSARSCSNFNDMN